MLFIPLTDGAGVVFGDEPTRTKTDPQPLLSQRDRELAQWARDLIRNNPFVVIPCPEWTAVNTSKPISNAPHAPVAIHSTQGLAPAVSTTIKRRNIDEWPEVASATKRPRYAKPLPHLSMPTPPKASKTTRGNTITTITNKSQKSGLINPETTKSIGRTQGSMENHSFAGTGGDEQEKVRSRRSISGWPQIQSRIGSPLTARSTIDSQAPSSAIDALLWASEILDSVQTPMDL